MNDARQRFLRDGYLITPPLFAAESLRPVRDEISRLVRAAILRARERGETIPDVGQLHLRSAICAEFCDHPAFAALATELLGPDIDLLWNTPIVKEPGLVTSAIDWHQDQFYAARDPMSRRSDQELLVANHSSVTAWAALTRTTVENGTLWVVPGGHRDGLLPHSLDATTGSWRAELETRDAMPIELLPGQVLVMSKYLPHSSPANRSREVRIAYQISYGMPGLLPGPARESTPFVRAGVRLSG